MEVNVWAKTNKVGSISENVIEIDDDDLKDMSNEEKDDYIDEITWDYVRENLIDWGWHKD